MDSDDDDDVDEPQATATAAATPTPTPTTTAQTQAQAPSLAPATATAPALRLSTMAAAMAVYDFDGDASSTSKEPLEHRNSDPGSTLDQDEAADYDGELEDIFSSTFQMTLELAHGTDHNIMVEASHTSLLTFPSDGSCFFDNRIVYRLAKELAMQPSSVKFEFRADASDIGLVEKWEKYMQDRGRCLIGEVNNDGHGKMVLFPKHKAELFNIELDASVHLHGFFIPITPETLKLEGLRKLHEGILTYCSNM
jgi:hypothetical protein